MALLCREMSMQTIETAPRDGSIVYVCNPGKGVGLVARWNKRREQWEGKISAARGTITVQWDKTDKVQPTHWREA